MFLDQIEKCDCFLKVLFLQIACSQITQAMEAFNLCTLSKHHVDRVYRAPACVRVNAIAVQMRKPVVIY